MPGYQTKVERIAISGVADLAIRSLLDRQQYSDPYGIAESLGISSATWPLFGLIWPSSLQLAELLAQRPVSASERILEIGCGLAIPSLVAHRRGSQITASDCHPLTNDFLRENLKLNSLPKLSYRHGQWSVAEVAGVVNVADLPFTALSDRYDLIVGSDLLYERDAPLALSLFINNHALPDAEVWLVDPNRGYRSAFNKHMAAHGFQLARDKKLTKPPELDGASGYKGRLLVYRRYARGS